MLTAVKGYYDGIQIVVDENDRKMLNIDDEVIITILDSLSSMSYLCCFYAGYY